MTDAERLQTGKLPNMGNMTDAEHMQLISEKIGRMLNMQKMEENKGSDEKIIDITEEYVRSRIIRRPQDSHKGTFGKVLCIAGSFKYRGAAALAVEGALRGGCGIVTLASVEPVFASVQPRLPEAILLNCEPDEVGGISASNVSMLTDEAFKDRSAVLMGPGMGNTKSTSTLVKEIVSAIFSSDVSNKNKPCTVVLDADALNAISDAGVTIREMVGTEFPSSEMTGVWSSVDGTVGVEVEVRKIAAHVIITPHPGEMARLCGCTIADIKADRERIITDFARENNCVVVLKEHRTLIALPDGRIYRNTTGNSGLARGGSGDILAGMMASFAASGMSAEDAAVCAVWMHGKSAELTSERKSETTMLPHDIFDDLGRLFREFGC